jgi:curved DNA-binding protein CbpA
MTHYEVLGVAETANQALIDAAWKIQMKDCHPDLHKGAKAAKQAQVVNQAHDILSNPQLRASYDLDLQAQRQRPKVQPIQESPMFDGQHWDDKQGFYPQPYANMDTLTPQFEDPGQFFALRVGEAFLEALIKKNPALKQVFKAAKMMDPIHKGARR